MNLDAAMAKGLPADLATERLVLGAMILYPSDSCPVAMDLLTEDDFTLSLHQKIFRSVAEMFAEGKPIGTLTVGKALLKSEGEQSGALTLVLGLTDGVPQILNLDSYCEILREQARIRSAAICFTAGAVALMSGSGTLDTIRDFQARVVALDAEVAKRESGFKPISDVIENRDAGGFDRFIKPTAAEMGIEWPLKSLTAMTGGFQFGNVTVVGAGTGKGKTTIATQCALFAAMTGHFVAILTPEMTEIEITKKIVAQYGRVCLSDWLRGEASSSDYKALHKASTEVWKLPIAIDDRSDVTPAMLDASLTRLRRTLATTKPELAEMPMLLIVDYIQLIDSGLRDDKQSREQHVSYISRQIKKLSKKHNLASLVLTQLTDEGKVRESRSIGMDASNVVILNDKGQGNYEAVLQKGRFSAVRRVPLFFDGATGLYFEAENK